MRLPERVSLTHSTVETQSKLKPALLRLSAIQPYNNTECLASIAHNREVSLLHERFAKKRGEGKTDSLERTDMHLERPRAENLEFKPRRREHFKFGCIREKRKDFSDRPREPKFAFQLANFHAGLGLVECRKSSSWLQNSSMLSVNNAPICIRVSR